MSDNKLTPKGPGQPSKYREEFCEQLIQEMAQGLSFEACAGIFRVSKETIYEWTRVHPEFAEAKKEGVARNHVFWEKLGLAGAAGKLKNFNAPTWIFNMKNRHGWRDKIEHSGEIDTKITSVTVKIVDGNSDKGE